MREVNKPKKDTESHHKTLKTVFWRRVKKDQIKVLCIS